MDDINNIMVAIGFTPYTEGIFSYGAKLATALKARLTIVSVINIHDVNTVATISSMGYEVDGQNYIEAIRKERSTELKRLIVQTDFPADSVKAVYRVGHPVEEILKAAVTEDVDLIVMGIKGRSDLEHAFIGSVADKIFRRSPVTVLSYRDEKSAAKLRKRVHTKQTGS